MQRIPADQCSVGAVMYSITQDLILS